MHSETLSHLSANAGSFPPLGWWAPPKKITPHIHLVNLLLKGSNRGGGVKQLQRAVYPPSEGALTTIFPYGKFTSWLKGWIFPVLASKANRPTDTEVWGIYEWILILKNQIPGWCFFATHLKNMRVCQIGWKISSKFGVKNSQKNCLSCHHLDTHQTPSKTQEVSLDVVQDGYSMTPMFCFLIRNMDLPIRKYILMNFVVPFGLMFTSQIAPQKQ